MMVKDMIVCPVLKMSAGFSSMDSMGEHIMIATRWKVIQ